MLRRASARSCSYSPTGRFRLPNPPNSAEGMHVLSQRGTRRRRRAASLERGGDERIDTRARETGCVEIVPGLGDEARTDEGNASPDSASEHQQRELIRQWIAERGGVAGGHGIGFGDASGKKDEKANRIGDSGAHRPSQSREKSESEMKPYKTSIPNTDVSFEMVPIKAGEFTHGHSGDKPGHKKDEAAAAQSHDRSVLDGEVRSDLG